MTLRIRGSSWKILPFLCLGETGVPMLGEPWLPIPVEALRVPVLGESRLPIPVEELTASVLGEPQLPIPVGALIEASACG